MVWKPILRTQGVVMSKFLNGVKTEGLEPLQQEIDDYRFIHGKGLLPNREDRRRNRYRCPLTEEELVAKRIAAIKKEKELEKIRNEIKPLTNKEV